MTTPPVPPAPTISVQGLLQDLEAIGQMAVVDAEAALKTLASELETQVLPALIGLGSSIVTALEGAFSGLFAKATAAVTSVSGTPNEDQPLSEARITSGAVQGGPSVAAVRQAYQPATGPVTVK